MNFKNYYNKKIIRNTKINCYEYVKANKISVKILITNFNMILDFFPHCSLKTSHRL